MHLGCSLLCVEAIHGGDVRTARSNGFPCLASNALRGFDVFQFVRNGQRHLSELRAPGGHDATLVCFDGGLGGDDVFDLYSGIVVIN